MENNHMEIYSDECDFIYIQCTPRDFIASPLYAKVIEFSSLSHATQQDHLTLRPEHEPAEEQYHEGDYNDEDYHDAGDEAKNEDDYEEDHDDDHDAVNKGDEDNIASDVTPFISSEKSGEDLLPPSPPKHKMSKRSKQLSNRTSLKDR